MAATAVQPRRFTLFDAMALVAAVAVGLVLSRTWAYYAQKEATYHSGIYMPSRFWAAVVPVTYSIVKFWPVVAATTPALILLRLRRPRPPRRRLFAPPGVAACVAASVVMVFEVGERVLSRLVFTASLNTGTNRFDEIDAMNLAMGALGPLSSTVVGFGVAAVWVAMTLAGRWRPERSWIDWAGRALGFLWLALIPVRFVFRMYYSYLG
jgi:hypothetical protein